MTPRSPHLALRARAAGFTLVELMVAIAGGLAVSVVVFALARDGNRFYKNESGVADATLAATIGFERLRNDIARAGFLSTPNILRDPLFCGKVSTIASWPDSEVKLLKTLASLRVTNHENVHYTEKSSTGPIQPQSILLSGAYDSVERFPAVDVKAATSGTGYVVTLQTDIGALARMQYGALPNNTEKTALLARLFPPNRALRLVSDTGRYQFGKIVEAKADASGATITLGANPPLVLPGGAANPCTVRGTATVVNVVNFIQYRLDDTHSYAENYTALFPSTAVVKWDTGRHELVREELSVTGAVLSTEIVAEYAVDLRFGVTMVRNAPATGPATQLETFPVGVADVNTLLGTITNSTTQRPQHARAMRVRMAVRARNPDRYANVAAGGSVAAGLYRIYLGTEAGRDYYARVRTLQSDVLIPAHQELVWQ